MNTEEEKKEELRALVDKYKNIYKRYLLVGPSDQVFHSLNLWQMRILLNFFTEHGQDLGFAVEGFRAVHCCDDNASCTMLHQ